MGGGFFFLRVKLSQSAVKHTTDKAARNEEIIAIFSLCYLSNKSFSRSSSICFVHLFSFNDYL